MFVGTSEEIVDARKIYLYGLDTPPARELIAVAAMFVGLLAIFIH